MTEALDFKNRLILFFQLCVCVCCIVLCVNAQKSASTLRGQGALSLGAETTGSCQLHEIPVKVRVGHPSRNGCSKII